MKEGLIQNRRLATGLAIIAGSLSLAGCDFLGLDPIRTVKVPSEAVPLGITDDVNTAGDTESGPSFLFTKSALNETADLSCGGANRVISYRSDNDVVVTCADIGGDALR